MNDRLAETPTRAPASSALLKANLAALARCSPRAARAVGAAQASPGLAFHETEDGVVTGDLAGRALCSRRRPLEEAERLAGSVDLEKAGAVVVLGFGLGHHVAALARRAREVSAIVVFEPDVALLRAVFERIDHSGWMSNVNLAFVTEPDNAATLTEAIRGLEGALAVGVEFLEHPPSRVRLGADSTRFAETFTRVFRAVRTHIITTMVQTDVTVRNELMNLDHYVRWPGIADLVGAGAGHPAIVVSAGPSLRRNIDALKTPGLRERCVIICVQTVLRQLLAEGIRPHFVTAIDYHEISKRFYEGLTPEQVADVTLICEARANPAILDAYPGPIRVPHDEFLTRLLARENGPDRGTMIPAATVAHLAYYVARHLRADPVILVGQDLAFTDGQYYGRGAAIHDVWAPELNPFNTLEMMEWQRIVRTRGTLHEARDHLGRAVYTDEQMATYLAQFERDFQTDSDRGLRIIDATEGGVAKAHTEVMSLAQAIERHASGRCEPLGPIPLARAHESEESVREARERVKRIRMDVRRIARRSRDARDLVRRMADTQRDVARTNRLIDEVNAIRDEVHVLEPAFGLVMRLNQMGALKRFKADRLIKLADALDPFDRQRRQIDRDAMNLEWVGEYADLLDGYLGAADAAFDGAPKLSRDTLPRGTGDAHAEATNTRADVMPSTRVAAFLFMDAADLERAGRPFLDRPVLGWTLARLARCRRIDTIGVVTDDPAGVRALIERAAPGARVEIIEGIARDHTRARSIGAGRAWADACWRGGLAGLTDFDEAFDPIATQAALGRAGADAAVVLAPTWGLIDPRLTDEVIARHVESPEGNALTFTQAPPGLAPAVVGRELVDDLAQGQRDGLVFASIAGALGYIPTRPRHDPIARPCCVQIDPALRGTLARFIVDDAHTARELEDALRAVSGLEAMCAEDVAAVWRAFAAARPAHAPREITLELTTTRPARGDRFWYLAAPPTRSPIEPERARRLVQEIARTSPNVRLTLAGLGDPLEHEACIDLVHAAKDAGIPFVHLRTDLLCAHNTLERLISSPLDVLSVDLLAHQAHTYQTITGVDRYGLAIENVDQMLRRRTTAGGIPSPWIVPRITRRDRVYEEIEVFFDKWILVAGAAVIDQLPESRAGERIEPLGKPCTVVERDARRRMTILCDGAVVADELDLTARRPVADVFESGVEGAWRALAERRRRCLAEGDLAHVELRTGW